MALVVKDRVKQTTTTTGTGSVVLNGTVSGFQTFAAALSNGDTTYYAIFEPSTNEYEVGLGTWTESSATLARTTVLESSNSGSAVSLTAQAEVFITQPAEKAVYLDASNNVTLSNNLTVSGDFTVSGTTTTIDTTNSVVTDSLVELSNGTSGSPSNDAGIVIERGSSDNAFIGYDESADKFTVGTGSFTGASTGNLTISTGTLVANVEGNVTGNVTGNVSGSSGSTTGNAATATALQNARTIAGQSFDGTGDITIAPTDLTGVNSTAAELNILDGVTSTSTELNLLDGVTATTTELNYVDGVTSAIQTQLDAKAPINNPTFTGSISHAGDLTIDVGGVIALDANNGVIQVKNNGNQYGTIYNSGDNFYVQSNISDGDLIFQGNDGGSYVTALTLDMSDAGSAIFNNHVYISDNSKLQFGAASDLQIYHDGSNSYIDDAGTGNLTIRASQINFDKYTGEAMARFRADGNTELFYDNSAKFATTSTGISITGNATFADNGKAIFGAGSDLSIYHDGSHSYISDQGTGNLRILAGEFNVKSASGNTDLIYAVNGGSVYLYHNGNVRITTNATGTDFVGTVTADGLTVNSGTDNEGISVVSTDAGSYISVADNGTTGSTRFGAVSNDFKIDVNSAERLRITSAGSVGIGTSSPNTALEVKQTSGTATIRVHADHESSSRAAIELMRGTSDTFGGDAFTDWKLGQVGAGSQADFAIISSDTTRGSIERLTLEYDTGNVGIGTSAPSRKLYISGGGSSRADVQLSYDALGTSAGDGVQLGIQAAGGYIWNFENSPLYFATNNSEAMRIDSSGRLLVGKTSNSNSTAGTTVYGNGKIEGVRDGGVVHQMNRLTSDGSILDLQKDGSSIGGIGGSSNILSIVGKDGNGGIAIQNNSFGDIVYPASNSSGSASDNAIDLGYSSGRWKDLYLSGGLRGDTLTFSNLSGTERMRIDSYGNVGIGNTNPTHYNSNADNLVVGTTSGHNGITISSGTDSYGSIYFSDGTSGVSQYRGIVQYIHSQDQMRFYTNSAQRMVIDSGGNLLVGKTSDDFATEGTTIRGSTSGSKVTITRDGNNALALNRLTSDGSIITFNKDGSLVGSIGTGAVGGTLYIEGDSVGSGLQFGNSNIYPRDAGALSNGAIDLGHGSYRFKDLYLSGSLSNGSTSRTVADIVGTTSSQFLRSDASDIITGDNRSLSFGTPGAGATTGARFLSIEGNSDSSGEGSGRIFFSEHNSSTANMDNYGFSIGYCGGDTNIVGASGNTWTGLSAIGNGEWGMWGHNNSAAGALIAHGPRTGAYTDFTGLKVGGNDVWHAGNDGAGSGLDADLLDGQQGSYYIDTSGTNQTKTGAFNTNSYLSAVQGVYSSNWFRAYGEEGLYSQDYGQHFYPDSGGVYWESDGPIRIRDGHEGTIKGYLGYHDSNGFGLLAASGNYWLNTPGDQKYLSIGGSAASNPWDGTTGVKLMFGSATANAIDGYYIGTNLENYGGNYNKLDIDFATGIRIKANSAYGGTRFYNASGDALLMSVGTGNSDVAVANALTAGGDITAYYSDERLKDFEGKIDGALDKVSKLNGYYFRENEKAKELGYENDARQVGVSAQEVEAVMPEVVKPAPVDPEYKTVQYEKLIPLLIEAIKELKEEVRQLKEDKA